MSIPPKVPIVISPADGGWEVKEGDRVAPLFSEIQLAIDYAHRRSRVQSREIEIRDDLGRVIKTIKH